MVFRCQTCKSRHVKCDAVQPICSRCKKAGRTCAWDPNDHVAETGLHFKIENSFAGGQPRLPRKVKELVPEPVDLPSLLPLSIPAAPSHAADVQAFHYWLENFMFRFEDLPDIGHEYNAYVIFHWARARPGSGLHLGLFAYSHAVFGRAHRVEKALEDADRPHSQAIVTMQKEMEDFEQLPDENIDQLLVTTMLMSSYQNTMYGIQIPHPPSTVDEVGSRLWQSLCHHEGALALLKLRQEHGRPPYLPLHRVVRRQVIRTCILRGVLVPDFLRSGGDYGEEGPALEVDAFMVQVATLRNKSMFLLSRESFDPPFDTQLFEHVAIKALELHSAIASWSESLPENWTFSTLSSSENLNGRGHIYSDIPHRYSTHSHATIWNRYRAIQLIVNSIRLRSLSHQLETLGYPSQRSFVVIQQEACRNNIELSTTELCAGVLFFFNSLDSTGLRTLQLGKFTITTDDEILPKVAGLLAWPLTVAVSCEYIPEPQRQWLKGKLKIVAKSLGDAVLESVVEQGEFRF